MCAAAGIDQEAIERRAAEVLASVEPWIWDGESLPIPVEHIADSCFGLLVKDVDDLSEAPGAPDPGDGETLSGLLLPARGEIWVNANEARTWPPRRRFTIGHELGHWVLHRTGQEALFCRASAVLPAEGQMELEAEERRQREPVPVIEEEASVFAAALLMPGERVGQEWEHDSDLGRMCEMFGSSRRAMSRRLHEHCGVKLED